MTAEIERKREEARFWIAKCTEERDKKPGELRHPWVWDYERAAILWLRTNDPGWPPRRHD